jgi:hypothetical protein
VKQVLRKIIFGVCKSVKRDLYRRKRDPIRDKRDEYMGAKETNIEVKDTGIPEVCTSVKRGLM